MNPSIDPARFREVLGHYPTGVCVVTAVDQDGTPLGMTVGTFTSVSLEPPLVAFLPDRSSTTFPRIRAAGAFCVNVLAAGQDDVCGAMARKGPEKFRDLTWEQAPSGSPRLTGVLAWVDCDLETVHDAGDHYIAIGRVRELHAPLPQPPLVFFRGRLQPLGTHAPLGAAS